jgi:hypothetical protein
MKYKVLFTTILLIALLATPILITSCSSTPQSGSPGYFLETLTKRDISFSFEYPDDYEKVDPNPYESAGSNIDIVGEIYHATDDETKTSTQLTIQLWNPTADYPDAKARLDWYATNVYNVGENPEINERSSLRVAGVDGEKLVYTYVLESDIEMPNQINCWVVGFDSKGQIWLISICTNIEAPEEAKADFDYLISTFKFLD